MRKLVVLGAGVALVTAVAAGAQRVVRHGPGASYPPPGPAAGPTTHPPLPPAPVAPVPVRAPSGSPQPWGSSVGGHWWGGVNAPGGWAGYREPHRGYRVPAYWVSPRFRINDWNYYGLPAPLGGYGWARYYDDAVMIDRGGQVYDWRAGLDWDGRYDDRRSNGLGGAVAGAAVGGVVGNVVAGRGDKLAGTLIGAGVGGAAGYAIDRGHDRRGPPPAYRDGYHEGPPPPPYDDDGPGYRAGPSSWVSADGRTTVTTTVAGGYPAPVIVGPAYGYAGGVTTISIQGAPVVTTTTTEIVEDSVTYTRPVYRKVYRKRVHYAARPRVRARCVCGS